MNKVRKEMKKVMINANIDEDLIKEFRGVVYRQSGLKKGDMKNAIAQAIIDYTSKHKDKK